MTRNVFFRARPAASIIAAAAASILIAGSVAAQDTQVGLDPNTQDPRVTQGATEISVDLAPAVVAYDAMIAAFEAMIADLPSAAAAPGTVFHNPATEPTLR